MKLQSNVLPCEYSFNDLAILRTKYKIQFSNAVAPIALPNVDLSYVAGLDVFAAGWNMTEVNIFD